jgi:hypothetical protein
VTDCWRDPAPIRNLLLDGARRWGLDHPIETARVFGGWKELVGDQVAARCEPASLGRGVLKVWAASPPWASELRYLAPEVIRRVNAGVGREVVRELKVALRPASGPLSGRLSGTAPGGPGGGRKLRAPGRRYLAGGEEDWGRAAPPSPPAGPGPGAAPSGGPSAREVERAGELVAPIADERLAEATKRAVLAAKMRQTSARGRGG